MLFIGIDIGTTAVKAALYDPDGRQVASWQRPYPTRRRPGGIVEQDPQDWLDGVYTAVAVLTKHCDPRSVRAIGICSQVNTHVFVDGANVPLAPAIVWQDTRAAKDAAQIDATITLREKLDWWGAPVPLDSSHALARIRWMQREQPEVWSNSRWVLSPKDFCILALTGTPGADPMASVGLVDVSRGYAEGLIHRVPGARERLPPLCSFENIVGEMSLASGITVPVVTGTMDAWSSLLGAGVFAAGKGLYMSGTSEILALAAATRIGAPGVITFPELHGIVVSAGPTQSGGDSVRWWAEATHREPSDVFMAAAAATRQDERILFLPHLQGERAPLWDPTLRGSFIGVSSRSGEGELALAVLEGVALSARLLLQSLGKAAGFHPASLMYGGGGSRSDLWSQIRADCLGVPLRRLAIPDAGCLGAAMLAAVGVGAIPRFDAAIDAMVKIERVFEPDERYAARYERMASAYVAATRALREINLNG